jgi:phage-related tail protein
VKTLDILNNRTWNKQELVELSETLEKDVRYQIKMIVNQLSSEDHDRTTLFLLRESGEIVAAASAYIKHPKSIDIATFSLYNIVSVKPKRGKEILQIVWDWAIDCGVKFYNIHVYDRAYRFYTRLGFRFWGVDISGQTFITFGKILGNDILESNTKWYADPKKYLNDEQLEFTRKNMEMFFVKHQKAMSKQKAPRSMDIFNQYKVEWKDSTLDSFFI